MNRIILLFIALFALGSCTYDYVAPAENLPTNVSFSQDVQPIFDQNCITCHNGSQSPDLRASNSYDALMSGNYINTTSAEQSTLYKRINGGGMPPAGKLSTDDLNKILVWIKEGAKNN